MEEEEIRFSLEEAINKLNRKPALFKDEKHLNINFTSEILHRKLELDTLSIYCNNLFNHPGTCSVYQFVIGKSGTGKTSAIKFFSRELINIANDKYKVPLACVHINCRIEKTDYRILTSILTSLKKKFPKRGYSPEDLVKILSEYLNDKNIYLLVVLDDLDYAVEDNSNILYYLTRIGEESTSFEQRLSIIGILKNSDLVRNISDDIGNVFHRKHIEFKPYNEIQLFDILKSKSIKAFKSGVIEEDLIKYVVSLIKQSGDLRCGMNVIWKAGKIAESEGLSILTKNCVDKAYNECNSYSSSFDYLQFKSKHLLRFLSSFLRMKIKNRNSKIYTDDVYEKYCELCKSRGKKSRSYSQIWNYLQELEKENILIIYTESNANGKRGRKSYIELVDKSLLRLVSEIENLSNSEGDVNGVAF